MDDGPVVALVPARGGSKGIPEKNLRLLGGRSLLAWAVQVAFAVDAVDHCIVSTDSAAIASEAERLGALVHERPAELASDRSPVVDTVRAVLRWLDTQKGVTGRQAVLLQPTSPLRAPEDVSACLRLLEDGADSAATFTEASVHPYQTFTLRSGQAHPFHDAGDPWLPRQLLEPPAYQLTGAVYAIWPDRLPADSAGVLFGTIGCALVPRERSVDIDEPVDLVVAASLLASRVTSSDATDDQSRLRAEGRDHPST